MRLAVMRNDDCIWAALIIFTVCDPESHINIIAEDVRTVRRAIHPAGDGAAARVKPVREVFSGSRVGVACLLKPVPRLDARW